MNYILVFTILIVGPIFTLYFPSILSSGHNGTVPPIMSKSTNVFDGNSNLGIHYRIPSVISTDSGTLIAFTEKRETPNDPGHWGHPISIVYKISKDFGSTWGEERIIDSDPKYDFSNPRAIWYSKDKSIILAYTRWSDKCGQSCAKGEWENNILYRRSTDDGWTWSNSQVIDVKRNDMLSINSGPGTGLELSNGRLIFPAIARVKDDTGNPQYRTFSIFSNDGIVWEAGELAPFAGATEGDLIELKDGRILLTSRNDGPSSENRIFMISSDGGIYWEEYGALSNGVQAARVDASMILIDDCVLLSIPLGNPAPTGLGRENLGVWRSCDNGLTFRAPKQIVSGFSAYSTMIHLDNGEIGIIYEAAPTTLIKFVRIANS